jgi:hypothetical protein
LLVQSCAFTPDVYPSDEHLELRFVQGTEVTLLFSQDSEHCSFSDPVDLGDTALFFHNRNDRVEIFFLSMAKGEATREAILDKAL